MKGLIINGSRNIFVVRKLDLNESKNSSLYFECRIKGKVLNRCDEHQSYNPLAPGDIVEFEPNILDNHTSDSKGQITFLHPRRNFFARLNVKGNTAQILGANIDLLLCVTTISSPPFRARFIDRLLLQAEHSNISVLILVNKSDLIEKSIEESVKQRLDDFKRIGYNIHFISCKTKDGIDQLRTMLQGKTSMLAGLSAVGKSSILNCLFPNANLKTGTLNKKYDRGNHTTVLSNLFEDENIAIIDTPGIRQFIPCGIEKSDVQNLMKDFAPFAGKCEFGASCSHNGERGCKIQEAIYDQKIHEDRFVSFLRIQQEIEHTKSKRHI